MGATVPSVDDQSLQLFINVIATDQDIRMPDGVRTAARLDDLKAIIVPCSPHSDAKPNTCWFNCQTAAASMSGASVVFGWHVFKMEWADGAISFAAGHHAVIEHSGVLVDVTPQVGPNGQPLCDSTLFVPDSRVPFDYENLRTVPALHWSPATGERFWSFEIMNPTKGRLPGFAVLRLVP